MKDKKRGGRSEYSRALNKKEKVSARKRSQRESSNCEKIFGARQDPNVTYSSHRSGRSSTTDDLAGDSFGGSTEHDFVDSLGEERKWFLLLDWVCELEKCRKKVVVGCCPHFSVCIRHCCVMK